VSVLELAVSCRVALSAVSCCATKVRLPEMQVRPRLGQSHRIGYLVEWKDYLGEEDS